MVHRVVAPGTPANLVYTAALDLRAAVLSVLTRLEYAVVRRIIALGSAVIRAAAEARRTSTIHELLQTARLFNKKVLQLLSAVSLHLDETKDQELRSALLLCTETLRKAAPLLLPALKVQLDAPGNDGANAAQRYAMKQISQSITNLIELVANGPGDNKTMSTAVPMKMGPAAVVSEVLSELSEIKTTGRAAYVARHSLTLAKLCADLAIKAETTGFSTIPFKEHAKSLQEAFAVLAQVTPGITATTSSLQLQKALEGLLRSIHGNAVAELLGAVLRARAVGRSSEAACRLLKQGETLCSAVVTAVTVVVGTCSDQHLASVLTHTSSQLQNCSSMLYESSDNSKIGALIYEWERCCHLLLRIACRMVTDFRQLATVLSVGIAIDEQTMAFAVRSHDPIAHCDAKIQLIDRLLCLLSAVLSEADSAPTQDTQFREKMQNWASRLEKMAAHADSVLSFTSKLSPVGLASEDTRWLRDEVCESDLCSTSIVDLSGRFASSNTSATSLPECEQDVVRLLFTDSPVDALWLRDQNVDKGGETAADEIAILGVASRVFKTAPKLGVLGGAVAVHVASLIGERLLGRCSDVQAADGVAAEINSLLSAASTIEVRGWQKLRFNAFELRCAGLIDELGVHRTVTSKIAASIGVLMHEHSDIIGALH